MSDINVEQMRSNLEARIREATRLRAQRVEESHCDHQWRKEQEAIPVTNDKFKGSAYFIFNVCVRCGSKEVIDYVVEAAA